MTSLSKPPSRLNRLSQFLPAIMTPQAKLSKDHQPVLRKPIPSESPIPAPPTRPPPAAPSQTTNMNATMPPPPAPPPPPPPYTSTPHKLQKQSTPPLQVTSPRDTSPSPHSLEGRRPRANSLLPPQPDMVQARSFSSPIASRPFSTNTSDGELDGKLKKRRSWLPGSSKSRSRNPSQDLDAAPSAAWVLAGGHQIDYNLNFLLGGDKIPELWDDSPEANMFVYLHPRSTGRGPQIKCHSLVAQCSQPLLDIIYDNSITRASGSGRSRGRSFDGRGSLSIEDATRNLAIRGSGTSQYPPKVTPDNYSGSDESGESIRSFTDVPRDLHLYYPVELLSSGPQFPDQDVQKLVDARNLFAFFNGQPLVSTRACPSIYHIFMNIASALKKFEFSNQDGTTFGEAADASFGFYLGEMRLADVRNSREKTVEGLILGERMRCSVLYNEAFAHAVGKFESITSLDLPIFKELTATTQLQLQQSSRDLVKQQHAASLRLTDFDFPSMFSGIASSTSSAESKIIRFKNWKANYVSMRKHVLSFYKDRYGQWPPKAGSKKNTFNEGGLNRLVLKLLYADLCALYDLLVDCSAFTTRGVQASEDRESGLDVSPTAAALRKLLAEYDRSSPPVQPPIPFDTPLIPTIQTVDPTYQGLSPKDQHKLQTRRLKEYEMLLLLSKSHNVGVDSKNQFLESYQAFEAKEGRGKNALELSEQRYGHWIFLYAVIQSLPLLVTDAPTLQFTESVEHFLCQMPPNPRPWLEDGGRTNRSWYNVAGGAGLVSLPSHMVEFSVEAVYSRSHCWKVAEQLVGGDPAEALHSEALSDGLMSPLQPPPGFGDGELRPSSRGRQRSSSTGGLGPHDLNRNQSRQSQRRSIALGLERLPGFPVNDSFDPDNSNGRPFSRGSISGVSPAISRGTSPMAPAGRRTASGSGDLGMGAQAQPGGGGSGSTFDDILGNMNKGHEKVEKKKTKKGFF
ncbi:hypothetical protein BKA65DRAFT_388987 [Rhexocercosporidium sp. MPI-PUGE-AT-0058]|nr:hypothetical protein BKA65DRAFT_388987 [Rhexocercosporidium sp. MPI-PUGE-AT-0058]